MTKTKTNLRQLSPMYRCWYYEMAAFYGFQREDTVISGKSRNGRVFETSSSERDSEIAKYG